MGFKLSLNTKLNLNIDSIVYLLCGVLVFSPISSTISIHVLRLPFAFPELILLPFLVFFYKKIGAIKINPAVIFGLAAIIFFAVLGIVYGQYSAASILSTTRGYLYIVIVFYYFKDREIKSLTPYFLIAAGSTFGWMISGIYTFIGVRNGFVNAASFAVYGNMISLSLFLSIPLVYNKRVWLYTALITSLIITITSGVRRQLVVMVVSLFVGGLLTLKITRILQLVTTIAIIGWIGYLVYPSIDKMLEETSPDLHYRIITKTSMIFEGEKSASDNIRLSKIKEFKSSLNKYIWPRGFVSKRTMKDVGANDFMDFPYTELFHTFGFIFLPLMLLFFINALFFHLHSYFKYGVKESAINIISGAVLLVLVMIEGSFLNFTFTVAFTGFVLARIFSRKNLVQ